MRKINAFLLGSSICLVQPACGSSETSGGPEGGVDASLESDAADAGASSDANGDAPKDSAADAPADANAPAPSQLGAPCSGDTCAEGSCLMLSPGSGVCAFACSAQNPNCPAGTVCYIPGDVAGYCLLLCNDTPSVCVAPLTCQQASNDDKACRP